MCVCLRKLGGIYPYGRHPDTSGYIFKNVPLNAEFESASVKHPCGYLGLGNVGFFKAQRLLIHDYQHYSTFGKQFPQHTDEAMRSLVRDEQI